MSGSFTNAVPVAPDGGQFQCAFTASGATQLDVIFAVTGTNSTNGFVLTVDRIKIGPDATVQAPIVTGWMDWDLSFASGVTIGNGTVVAKYKRVGNEMVGIARFTLGSTSSVSGAPNLNLPTGLTKDLSAIVSQDNDTIIGEASFVDTGSETRVGAVYSDGDSDQIQLRFQSFGNPGRTANITSSSPFVWAATDIMNLYFRIPIAEWSQANAVLSTAQADKQVMIARIYKTSNQSVTSSNPTAVSWQAVDIDTHGMANVSNNRIDILQDGTYLLNMQFRMSGSNNNGFTAQIAIDGTGTYVGAQSGGSGNTVGPGITAIAELTAGQQVSAIIDSNSDTSYTGNAGIGNSYLSVTRIPDFSTFSTYGPYEYLEAEVTANTQTDSATSTDVTGASLIISAGTWLLCYSVELQLTNSTGSTTSVEGRLELTDSSNALIENISSRAFLELGNGDLHIQHHDVCGVHTTTASKTVKLRVNNGTGTTNEFARVNDADPNTQSLIKARRLK